MGEDTRKELDAIELLMQDHRELESLFSEFEYLEKKGADTTRVIQSACAELKIHDALENDIFYPAVSDAASADDVETLLDDAEDAHDSVLDLMGELDQMDGNAAPRNAHFKLIVAEVKEHILIEEAALFPAAQKLKLDIDFLGIRIRDRRSELMAEADPAEATASA
jgi:iron-sulfur cluster repair protein YtfE (RIC family)